jgi:hypothetical protein
MQVATVMVFFLLAASWAVRLTSNDPKALAGDFPEHPASREEGRAQA